MKIKKTAWVVIAFILLLSLTFCAEAQAGIKPVVGLSGGMLNAKGMLTQRIGVLVNDRWGMEYERFGGSDYETSNAVNLYRRAYVGRSALRGLFELGITYFDKIIRNPNSTRNRAIVNEHLTFHLGVGGSLRLGPNTDMEIKWVHNSTAGRSNPNSGIDRVALMYTWRF